jgi:hypothetical protein
MSDLVIKDCIEGDCENRVLIKELNAEIARLKAALDFAVNFKITDSNKQEVPEDSLHEIRKEARKALEGK